MKKNIVENRAALLQMVQRANNQGQQSIAKLAMILADETQPFELEHLDDLVEQTIALDDALLTFLLIEWCVDNSIDYPAVANRSKFRRKLSAGIKSLFGLVNIS